VGRAFAAVLVRDLTLALRRRSELANPLVFFLVVVTLFPLALGPEKDVLSRVAPGVLWVAALLASTMAMESVFRSDYEDGALEQLLLSPQPPSLLVLAKIAAHWLVTGLPLLVASPVLGLLLHLPAQALPTLLASLALGTPILSLVGAIGVALTVGLRRGGLLMTLLVLPLYVPVLIFGAGAVDNAAAGLPVAGQLYFLAAVLMLAVTLAPMAAAAALRISLG
jgi:heme exporter protein B